ncbi:Transposable element Tcb2 transposase, partial [Stegodyphus mimosarum]
MFSDESRFSLSTDSRRVTIWRERGTRFEPRNISERYNFPSRGVIVWVGIMMDGRTDHHFFDTGSVTGQRYRDEVLEPYVRLFRGAVDPHFIFMDDNAPCHRAVLVDDFLEMENIQHMSWPANSPDLNTIEHIRRLKYDISLMKGIVEALKIFLSRKFFREADGRGKRVGNPRILCLRLNWTRTEQTRTATYAQREDKCNSYLLVTIKLHGPHLVVHSSQKD